MLTRQPTPFAGAGVPDVTAQVGPLWRPTRAALPTGGGSSLAPGHAGNKATWRCDVAGGGVARAQHRPLGRPLSRSPPGLAPLCPVLGTLHCHLPELLRAAPTLTLLSVTRRACLTAGDSSAPVHPLHACQERGGPGGGCKRLKSSRVPRAPGGREGSAKHVWGPDLRLLRQVRKRRGRLRVPAHHHLPPPPHRCPGAELSTVAFSSSGHCGKTVLHI